MRCYIETKNLILREFRDSDLEGLFELESNTEVHTYLGNTPIKTKKEAEKIISFFYSQYEERGIGRFATIEKSSGKFVGWTGLKFNQSKKEMLNGQIDFTDIGYRLIPEFWGKGYATEASLASLDYGFKERNIDSIYAAAEVANAASNRVLKKIGLLLVNEFIFKKRNCYWYELKKESYELQRMSRVQRRCQRAN